MNKRVDFKDVGDRVRTEREKLQISREKFAEILNLSPFFVGQIERGERKMSISTLISVSECLHVSLDYLIFGEVYKVEENNDLQYLLSSCSSNEVKVIEEIAKVVLPFVSNKKL
ncbi:helix-turn-helix transcriptional regulator [Clostridium sp. C2-6-12]|uniref:helix-turn-helix domain-containing protein n=1 Tax=Clostridium sp. C2-6-12 TaxID=2698832 RepID=UPI001371AFEF|nr:helix-turn-helix transcriptional regulator [Clostridium sp. C2-6-12]